jgi:uncharacterized protein with FMN-binding domain
VPSRSVTAAVAATAVLTPTATVLAPVALAASSRTYRGSAVSMHYGPVQVTITVQGHKVTAVSATAPTDRPRSKFINDRAVPILRSEALRAQSASVNKVSGATLTSRAFASSLSSALHAAHL